MSNDLPWTQKRSWTQNTEAAEGVEIPIDPLEDSLEDEESFEGTSEVEDEDLETDQDDSTEDIENEGLPES